MILSLNFVAAAIRNSVRTTHAGALCLAVGVGLVAGCAGDDGDSTATETSPTSSETNAASAGTTDGSATDSPVTDGATSGGQTGSATDPATTTAGTTATTTAGTTTAGTTASTMTDTDTDTGDGVLEIMPEDVVIEVVDGNIPMQMFTATYNGEDVTDDVEWLYEKPTIGSMMMGSTFVPTGQLAGIGTLFASYQGAQDETSVAVKIIKNVDPDGLEPMFGDPAGADPSMSIVYPYDETVFPLNVASQIVQWNGVQNGDIYKLQLTEQYYDYTVYFSTNTPARHLIDQLEWTAISESGQGPKSDPLMVSLQRHSGGMTYEPVEQTWHIAQARLPGRIYYWELPDQCNNGANGRVLTVKPSDATAEEFYNDGNCWGCHTVSRDGRTVMGTFSEGSPFPMASIDVSVEPAVIGDIDKNEGVNGVFSAFNHDGSKLLFSLNGGGNPASSARLKIADAVTAAILNDDVMAETYPAGGCGEPAWSFEGELIAAICGMDGGNWTFDSGAGDLVIADVNGDGHTVSNITTLVPQAGGDGRPAYPNFSPGDEWIVFGRPTTGSRSTGNGDLWIVGTDGNDLRKLDIASSDNRSFNPTFAPLRAGGYFWVTFITRRDYGNTLVGANRQQLWITAISDPPNELDDPSNPPFYIRGQEDCAKSENAYFAPDPCIEDPDAICESGIDCCGGQCVKPFEDANYKICGEAGECIELGNACEEDADCCTPGAHCVDGYCVGQIPE